MDAKRLADIRRWCMDPESDDEIGYDYARELLGGIDELEAVLRKVRDDLRDAHLGEGYRVNLHEIADHIATVLK